jgi:predicted DNA binding protein
LDFGPWFWVYFLFAYTLLVVGFVLLLRLVVVSEYFYLDQTVLVVVGILAPLTGNALSVFELAPLPGLDLTPVGFTVTGVAFGNAFLRYRLFDILPATRQLSNQAALAAVDDGVVIVGDEREILYLNDAAADILDCDPGDRFGDPVETVLSTEELDFESEDAFAELVIGERTYEVTTAPITDQRDRLIGHTILLHDVTSRVRRERELRRQRDELARLDQLNRVIRNVNGALVSATTRDGVVRGVCETFVTEGPYEAVRLGLGPIPGGDLVGMSAGDDGPQRLDPEEALPDRLALPAPADEAVDLAADRSRPPPATERGAWVTVPLVYRRTVYGMLALRSGREEGFVERERDVLAELGETIGHAIHAVEQRQLLVADTATELEFCSTDPGAVLVSLSEAVGPVTLDGLVPGEDGALLAYVTVDGAAPEDVTAAVADGGPVTGVRPINENGSATVELSLAGGSLCCPLVEYGANVRSAEAADGTCRVVAEVSPEADVRTVVERVTDAYPETELVSKRELTPADGERGLPSDGFEDLTERQREALEAAYRAGYFEWPRDSTAEEVAESMGVSSPTLHSHLRKAEHRLFSEFFDRE